MIDRTVHPASGDNVEAVLREELARGDAMAETVLPILRHLIAAEDSSVFSEEILARVRGMLADLAGGMLDAMANAAGPDEAFARDDGIAEQLTRAFMDNPALISHLHALALEWQLTERMQARLALDPVVSPMLQELISSPDEGTQGLAMTFLAAQARWCQTQRRMTLPFRDLPGDLLHGVLASLRSLGEQRPDLAERTGRAETAIREAYDEGASRLGLAWRLVMTLGDGNRSALSLTHGGVALFLTALALGSGQARDVVVLSTHEAQLARLALALRTAGLEPSGIEEQFLALHPDVTLPEGFDRLGTDSAASILASGHQQAGHYGG
ncbi:hypothetical protein [Novosphingobium mangrovi (ex Huang et al. 2023)]|uniref:DUF2336 domain-containing protein n=1 Tax=Novosphingobium mangrovi (ex Huang et al. 2023) TaxID=2976432 RepID=A0ABT2I3X8_9SPHN|nr:hypothetical protein [Novosphingobium mangrovi (ex Huang et al. 2023)]MCT2399512.1 hypothetical protein [Novosphingobium mangrovi (ex Huang et al. 2023)]